MGFIEETTEGELKELIAGSQFVKLREGFSFDGAVESLDSNELTGGDIGMSKSFVSKEVPTGSLPKYLKGSGFEGVAPDYSVLIKSAMGSQVINSTEYQTTGVSVAGDALTQASLTMGSDEEDNFVVGQAVLIKDGVSGYSIRNVESVDSAGGKLALNYNLSAAPATATKLGKAIAFKGSSDHKTFSAHRYQAKDGSAFKNAMAGCRTTSMSFEYPALGFASGTFEFAGTKFFYNHIRIDATNKFIDFTDDVAGDRLATLEEKVYGNAHELAREISSKMTAASVGGGNDTITCIYSDVTGKFTISSNGSAFGIKWKTGSKGADNTDTHAGTILGFSDATDLTGAVSYTGVNAQTYSSSLTPVYDEADNLVVKGSELMIGGFDQNFCRKATTLSFSISTPKTDALSICAENGIDSSVTLSREATFSATLLLQEHEVGLFDKFVNNTTTQLMFNTGTKSANNWEAGKCMNIYMANASITAHPIADSDGYQVVNVEAKAFVTSSKSDVYINFL